MKRRGFMCIFAINFIGSDCINQLQDAGNRSQTPASVEDILEMRDRPSEEMLNSVDLPPAEPPKNKTSDTVSPINYPAPLRKFTEDDVESNVDSFERAYRRNLLLREHGRFLIEQSFDVDWVQALVVGEDAAIGRIQYRYSESIDQGGEVVIGDSPTIVASYYLDESLVVRAEDKGRREQRDELDPDPWETGEILVER